MYSSIVADYLYPEANGLLVPSESVKVPNAGHNGADSFSHESS